MVCVALCLWQAFVCWVIVPRHRAMGTICIVRYAQRISCFCHSQRNLRPAIVAPIQLPYANRIRAQAQALDLLINFFVREGIKCDEDLAGYKEVEVYFDDYDKPLYHVEKAEENEERHRPYFFSEIHDYIC